MLQLGLGSVQAKGKRSVSRFRLRYSLGSECGTVPGYIAKKCIWRVCEMVAENANAVALILSGSVPDDYCLRHTSRNASNPAVASIGWPRSASAQAKALKAVMVRWRVAVAPMWPMRMSWPYMGPRPPETHKP
jgi:hypothetical protein